MAFGTKDARGIYQFGEDDAEATFSQMLNKGMQSVSDATKYFSGTPAQRAALAPAPAGAIWVDTDSAGRVWRVAGGVWCPEKVGVNNVTVKAAAAANTPYSLTITFPAPFDATPTVVATPYSTSIVGSPAIVVRNVSATGFVVEMAHNLGTRDLACNWLAVR